MIRHFAIFLVTALICGAAGAQPVQRSPGAQFARDAIPLSKQEIEETLNLAEYQIPTSQFLAKLLVRFNSVTIKDPVVVDEYARIVHCNLYEQFFIDDFQWQELRDAMRQEIIRIKDDIPTRFYVSRPINLERYNFRDRTFPIHPKSEIKALGYFEFSPILRPNCEGSDLTEFAEHYTFVARSPLSIRSIHVPPEEARDLIRKFANEAREQGEEDRTVYLRLYLTVQSVIQHNTLVKDPNAEILVKIDHAIFYKDPEYTEPFYRAPL